MKRSLLVLLTLSAALMAQIVTNGFFEAPDTEYGAVPPGWTISGNAKGWGFINDDGMSNSTSLECKANRNVASQAIKLAKNADYSIVRVIQRQFDDRQQSPRLPNPENAVFNDACLEQVVCQRTTKGYRVFNVGCIQPAVFVMKAWRNQYPVPLFDFLNLAVACAKPAVTVEHMRKVVEFKAPQRHVFRRHGLGGISS